MGQLMEFVRFIRKGGLGSLRGLQIKIHDQNYGGTGFAGMGRHFSTRFRHNSTTVGRTVSGASPSCSSWNFTYGEGKWAKILDTCQLSKMTLL